MDAVLGLSVTPSAVGLVLVEGQDADGSTVDGEAFEIVSGRHATPLQTSERAPAAVLRTTTSPEDDRRDTTTLVRGDVAATAAERRVAGGAVSSGS